MQFIYGIGIRIFYALIWFAGLFNPKAKSWLKGQNQEIKSREQKCIWIHCASLGEYKQAQPLVTFLEKSGHEIVFTFFSPSGYNQVKTQHTTYYLPLDTYSNAEKFIENIKPTLAIFVRSEYWFNHITVLSDKNIPLVIINCYLNNNHFSFNWYGKWFYKKLKSIRFFYTINEETTNLLSTKGLNQNLNMGDTKVDQVIAVKNEPQTIKSIPKEKKIILCASIEAGDQGLVKQIINHYQDEFLIILVPHEHSLATFNYYKKIVRGDIVKYSTLSDKLPEVIYIDEFGILPSLFKYAWISYVGGGFDKGIHNILESCIEQTPIILGPKFTKFPEAQNLTKIKAAIAINDPGKIIEAIDYFKLKNNYEKATLACKLYIDTNKGATNSIYDHLKKSNLI